jgi:selenide,water dikinase
VANRGPFWARGKWVWQWKNRIDRKFLAQFDELPLQMSEPGPAGEEVMHCGGCGAKLPAAMLRQVLSRLAQQYPAITDSESYGDDAALLEWKSEEAMVQSVDTLREFLHDPWLMGRVSLLHAISDIYAMGGTPHSALAHITLPYAADSLQERDLEQFMDGALREMEVAGCRLIGGHSLEGPELSAGFTVNGTLERNALLKKASARHGDRLILSSPLGTGVIFAAHQQGAADGRWITEARATMLHSNGAAALIASEIGSSACTDVTGFGLLGHLLEMLQGRDLKADVYVDQVPLLAGTVELFNAGFESSLQGANKHAVARELANASSNTGAEVDALFDPQTSGGLLIAVAEAEATNCLQRLQEAGYGRAAIIGEIHSLQTGEKQLSLTTRG